MALFLRRKIVNVKIFKYSGIILHHPLHFVEYCNDIQKNSNQFTAVYIARVCKTYVHAVIQIGILAYVSTTKRVLQTME